MVSSLHQVNILENQKQKPPKLMYRPPNTDKYVQIAEALDELFNRLEAIETKLESMEKS